MTWLLEILNDLVRSRFTGKLEINFYQGGVAKINKLESIEVPK